MAIELIVLTGFGETLIVDPHGIVALQISDETELPSNDLVPLGIHHADRGFVYLKPISATHNVVFCTSCGRIVVVPNQLKTYGALRQHCRSEIMGRGGGLKMN